MMGCCGFESHKYVREDGTIDEDRFDKILKKSKNRRSRGEMVRTGGELPLHMSSGRLGSFVLNRTKPSSYAVPRQ